MKIKLIGILLIGALIFTALFILYINWLELKGMQNDPIVVLYKILPGVLGYSFIFSLYLRKFIERSRVECESDADSQE